MSDFPWRRVTKANPCPICDRPDWCCVGRVFANCMRVESDRPCNNGGWLHSLTDKRARRPYIAPERIKPLPPIDAARLMEEFQADTTAQMLTDCAAGLGVSVESIELLGAAYSLGHCAWAWPMKDWRGAVIGIRLRSDSGHKWAVKGSRAGLIYAEGQSSTCYICEGPTDTAAGLTIGMECIGRPSCLGQGSDIDQLLRRKHCRRAIIVSDNDGPGHRGALKLMDALTVATTLWTPPAKDLREFTANGGTLALVSSLLTCCVWQVKRA